MVSASVITTSLLNIYVLLQIKVIRVTLLKTVQKNMLHSLHT
jgi:hypothetical protein